MTPSDHQELWHNRRLRTSPVPKLVDVSDFVSRQRKGGQDCDWGEDYRAAGRAALAEILERQMALRVDRHLEEMAARKTSR